MSSNDNYQHEGYPKLVGGRSYSEVAMSRPPNQATESLVLAKLRNDQTQPASASQAPKPNSAFSNPPPSINQYHNANASQPHANAPQPQATASFQIANASQSHRNASQPVVNLSQSHGNASQPVVNLSQSHGNASHQIVNTSPQIVNASQPIVNLPQPHLNTTQPSLNASHPIVNSSHPIVNSSQPVMKASQLPLTLPEIHSNLSVDAKVFVPSQVSNASQECVADVYPLNVTAAEFVPRLPLNGFSTYPEQYFPNLSYENNGPDPNLILEDFNYLNVWEPYDTYASYNRSPENDDNFSILARFNNALKVLNLNPGNMEDYLRPICNMIQESPDTTEIVNDVIESLFEQSLLESNFRYTGARICQYLKSKLKSNPYFSGFHKLFLQRCQKEYDKRSELKSGTPADQERLRGLSLFLAEIFLNVQAEAEDGTSQYLNFLPVFLVDLVKTLLSTPTDADVKCSCQLLKLAGSLIDDKVKNSSEECIKFEEIFPQLHSLQSDSKLTENAKFLIGSVLKLKDADWNRSSFSPPKKSLHTFISEINSFKAPEPVFYNQLGTPCTRKEAGLSEEEDEDGAYILNEEEEAAFLEWQAEQELQTGDSDAWGSANTGYGSFQLFSDDVDDGGMGDELEDAYEEFLQKQNFAPAYKPPQQQPVPNVRPQQEAVGYPQQQPYFQPGNPQQNRTVHISDQQVNHAPSNSLPQLHQVLLQNHLPYHQDQQLPQQNMLPLNSQSHPLQNPQQNQQQQLRDQQQQYQPNFPKNDRFHFNRR